jgi:protein-S-isoprenylcysteine O-methyltransferase Ste14
MYVQWGRKTNIVAEFDHEFERAMHITDLGMPGLAVACPMLDNRISFPYTMQRRAMDIESLLRYVVIVFPVSEIALTVFKRSAGRSSVKGDRGSLLLLWLVIIGSVSLAVVLQWHPVALFQVPRSITDAIALFFLIGGLIIRWVSIISLGKFFTVDVAIHDQHVLLRKGLYEYVRHPSYTGLLLEFAGLSVYLGTWITVGIVMIPITCAILYRIRCEEIALLERFGKQYEEYMAQTKSFIPGIA